MGQLTASMRRILKRVVNRFGFELVRRRSSGVPATRRENLEMLEREGSDREWHQVMMYCHVIELTRDVPGDIVEFGVASGT